MQADNDNERLVLEFFSVLSAADFPRLRGMLHDEITWTPMMRGVPGAGVHRGREGVIDRFLVPIRALFRPGEPRSEVRTICSKGSLVMAECHGTGHVADGRVYDNLYAWAFEIEDGRILAVREYMDSLYVARLFGMAKDA